MFLGVAETIVGLLLSWCGYCSVSFRPGRGGLHMKGVGMLVVSLRGVNFGFWSHLGCSGQNAIIFSREGLIYKNMYCLCLNMVSFRGQKKLGPRPDRSPLGVYFKISDEHPHPFHMRSPLRPRAFRFFVFNYVTLVISPVRHQHQQAARILFTNALILLAHIILAFPRQNGAN